MNIKAIIKMRGLTIGAVAKRMGISRVALSNHINGNPSISVLERIAEAIGCDVSDFFDRPDNFIAFVRCGGRSFVFESKEELKEFAEGL